MSSLREPLEVTRPSGSLRVLVVSASMGAGHDGAARNLASALAGDGHEATVRDFLDAAPLGIGGALRRGYELELRHAPSAYELTYRLWYRLPWLAPVLAWLICVLARRTVLRWVDQASPDVVVSTYPLATLCLGRLRQLGRLGVPVVNFITDFGVHPLWVHKGVDLNLAVHPQAAAEAFRRSKKPALACGPAVGSGFCVQAQALRDQVRASLGLSPKDRAVLVVAGSWGVGNLVSTWRAIATCPDLTPVVVCGRDQRLAERIRALSQQHEVRTIVLGWTDEMPYLMAAADALVENAGGLTAFEAMRSGLPVVSFEPIAGHGRENTARMHAAGVSHLAQSPEELRAALWTLCNPGPLRDQQVARAQALFRDEPASLIASATASPQPRPALAANMARVGLKALAGMTALCGLGWLGLTSGVAFATEAGAGVAHPGPGSSGVAFIGVRLDGVELADPVIRRDLALMDLTAVIDASTAAAHPGLVRSLALEGVDVENGGLGEPATPDSAQDSSLPWDRARRDVRSGDLLEAITGRRVALSVLGRRATAWDLLDSGQAHMTVVVPDHQLMASRPPEAPLRIEGRSIYLLNGLGATPDQLVNLLNEVRAALDSEDLSSAPLVVLH